MKKQIDTWSMKEYLLNEIQVGGGWVNAHAHFDRAYTVSKQILNQADSLMEKKWTLVDEMKRNSSEEDYQKRIERAVISMIDQGVTAVGTFIDVDPLTELRALRAAGYIKKKYEKKITLVIINQTLKGLVDEQARIWAQKALPFVDIIGGLPSKDRPHHEKHLDILMGWAKETGKMIHVHIDQENNPDEHDTELLAKKTIEHHLEGKVVAVHAISLSAQSTANRLRIYKYMKEAGLMVVCSPSAALSMKPLPKTSHLHNSIAPVPELLREGVPVALGADNIADIYQPLVDGDMYTELRILAESCRFYKMEELVRIATVNGKKVLGMQP